jgi:hypothetical protein
MQPSRINLAAVLAATIGVNAAFVKPKVGLLHVRNISVAAPTPAGPYGRASCPCVGIDNLEGHATATLKDGTQASYPKDIGARCEAWDKSHHPKCPGDNWCESKWCYVDPCNCEDVGVLPKTANYFPGAEYQGKPVHFSYAACDAMDSYTEEKSNRGRFEEIEKTCATHVDVSQWGQEDCRCVGISPQPGTTKVSIDGKKHDFPSETGATCYTWDKDNHPDCSGASPPSWCKQAWCYVDPCKCKATTPPKTSSYLPESNYQGKPIYYSYQTCGGTDSYTATEHKEACVNQKTNKDCGRNSKCAWDGKQCLGKELVEVCSGAWSAKVILVLAMPLLTLIY